MKTEQVNQKFYYCFIIIIIFLMIMGWVINYPVNIERSLGWKYFLHLFLLCLLSVLLLIYPIYETYKTKLFIIVVGAAYFYYLFYLYPETWSSFVLISFIPAIAILFFDERLFYFSVLLNCIVFILFNTFLVFLVDKEEYLFFQMNPLGNMLNFLGSQAILVFIFSLMLDRMKKQQIYYEQLQQAERLKMTGQLAAAVAHEIRNPLTVVKGFLQFYEEDKKMEQDVKRNFSLMIDELNVAEQVISQFLMIAKPDEENERDELEINYALSSVCELLRSYGLFRDNRISLHVEEECVVQINVIEFKQLMINIIKNAMEASEKGKEILVEAKKKDGMVEICVKDWGCGMSIDQVEKLGIPFYSLKSKGTGLGMMICFQIVEKYKGKINIYSKPSEGTTVKISFPIVTKRV